MKNSKTRLAVIFTVIPLLLLFGLAAHAGAQAGTLNRLGSSPESLGKTGKTQETKIGSTASGYTYTVLHSFCAEAECTDGWAPMAGLIQDAAGNLYGTTSAGGTTWGGGTVFKVDSTGQETVLYNFCSRGGQNCTDGWSPVAGLIQDAAGNLYGTTSGGGHQANFAGTVFKLDSTGHEKVLYNFCSVEKCADGLAPAAGLVQDAAGNLYGTTQYGGTGNCDDGFDFGCGTVFKLTGRTETVLYSFTGTGGDDAFPSGLMRDAKGNLYGTTPNGGANYAGTVFKVDSTDHEKVLYNFCSEGGSSCTDGYAPTSGLIRDAEGNLYGTTAGGGANGGGTVFKLDKKGHETVLYNFCSEGGANCTDGGGPNGLMEDAQGNRYGTTAGGGANGYGTVFKLDRMGQETVLYSFCSVGSFPNCTDGWAPAGGLIQDAAGNLYGTTSEGGANYYWAGTVFKLTPSSVPPSR